MDIEELNKQMSFFQNEYSLTASHQQLQTQNQSINFPPPLETPIPTTQIKRPSRTTGDHRNEINDKMTQMKMNQPMMVAPNQFQAASAMPAQTTRNNSQYQQQHIENLPNLLEKHFQNEQHNPLSSYFQQNYSTLNGNTQYNPSLEQFNIPTNMQQQKTIRNMYNSEQYFINPDNKPILTTLQSPTQSSIINEQHPGNGYHKIDEKRIDYRQNMNSAVGNFIFNNPNAAKYNPQHVAHNLNGYTRDTRMVIQDSSKDMYRQETNSRMSQYSPLARASHVPINIANMSVNDFYANMNERNPVNQYKTVEDDARAILNARMGAYTPLAKVAHPEKTKSWQDNNVNRANPLVAHEELPVLSH